jgi:hypothetical protein
LLAGALVLAALCFLAPIPEFKEFFLAARALRTQAPIAIAGNSSIAHVSKCDSDGRTLLEMIQDQTAEKTEGLNYNGQSFDDSIQFTSAALQNQKIKSVIVLFSLAGLQQWDQGSLQRYLFFKLLNPSLQEATLRSRVFSPAILNGEASEGFLSFRYKGVEYPEYKQMLATYFERESEDMPCPERDGKDLRFIEAYYDHNYLRYPLRAENFDLLASMAEEASRRGKQFLLVIAPIDFDLMNQLNPEMAASVRAKEGLVFQVLKRRKVNVLDLGDALRNEDFADRYCACGHMVESGRRKAAQAIADALTSAGGR